MIIIEQETFKRPPGPDWEAEKIKLNPDVVVNFFAVTDPYSIYSDKQRTKELTLHSEEEENPLINRVDEISQQTLAGEEDNENSNDEHENSDDHVCDEEHIIKNTLLILNS